MTHLQRPIFSPQPVLTALMKKDLRSVNWDFSPKIKLWRLWLRSSTGNRALTYVLDTWRQSQGRGPFNSQTLTQLCPRGRWVVEQPINRGWVWAEALTWLGCLFTNSPQILNYLYQSTVILYAEKHASAISIHQHHLFFMLFSLYTVSKHLWSHTPSTKSFDHATLWRVYLCTNYIHILLSICILKLSKVQFPIF